MTTLTRKIKNKYELNNRTRYFLKVEKYIAQYLASNNLNQIIGAVDNVSAATGADKGDYVALHAYIRRRKPEYVLECGTGKTTWVMADALKKNFEESGVKGKLISMEDVERWHAEAVNNLPAEYEPFVEIVLSPAAVFNYSFFRGTAYVRIPDYPYDLFFVDGPNPEFTESGVFFDTINLDFIRYVSQSERPTTALIDYRLKTTVAYGMVFGRSKVKFLKPWNLGIIENVTNADLRIITKDFDMLIDRVKMTTSFDFASPSWMEVP